MLNKKTAVTLAEILIVLALLGIIIAMMLPSFIEDVNKKAYVVGYRKAFSTVNQALYKITYDNGCIGDIKCTGLFSDDKTTETFGDEFVKYFKIIENCRTNPNDKCWPKTIYQNYDQSNPKTSDNDGYYNFIGNDGVAYSINNYADNCQENKGTGPAEEICGEMDIDINGPGKGPNARGRDIFFFFITNGRGPKLHPYGAEEFNANRYKDGNCCNESNKDGFCCAARIVADSWIMKY